MDIDLLSRNQRERNNDSKTVTFSDHVVLLRGMNDATKTVLLVEDDAVNAIVFTSFMEEWGLIVRLAHNGMEAIRMTREGEKFHLILMDINMPLMNGIEAITELRKTDQQTPVIVITGGSKDAEIVQALSVGANDYIFKPVSEAQLLHVVTKWLAR